ncbi:ATP-binding protein [Ectothiorhodospiraceae bacterium BW-2]|nr:ATP-binding protein [Ectothiorhodospiraceae bacterium BW-2]
MPLTEKFFNTAGPQKAEINYTINPLQRINWEEIRHLIDSQRYFLLHAPRQTGKTTTLLSIVEALNNEGRYTALYANIETAQTARSDVAMGVEGICRAIANQVELYWGEQRLKTWLNNEGSQESPHQKLQALLQMWARHHPKPIILLLDEVDALIGDTLVSLLRQLRAGYTQRPQAFPQSVLLCGVRDIKDYRIHQSDGDIITGGSAFNVKAKSLTMGNFTETECHVLYQQHTAATGQPFAEAIFPELWLDTAGQPWLVNALAHQLTWEEGVLRDRSQPITLNHYFAARERLIQSRATHLDQLTDKLKEPRVRGVIAPILAAEDELEIQVPIDDRQYCEDLGLVISRPSLRISNRIYQEVIPRELTWMTQTSITNQEQSWYLAPDHRLDMIKLLQAFQQFFREHSQSWIQRFDYHEAGPQLLLQAFLQRIINGGGRINREYALGRRRTDLIIEWPVDEAVGLFGEVQRIVIELKILRSHLKKTLQQGIEQSRAYADSCGAAEVHLIIFNRNPKISWGKKIWYRAAAAQNGVHCWGC